MQIKVSGNSITVSKEQASVSREQKLEHKKGDLSVTETCNNKGEKERNVTMNAKINDEAQIGIGVQFTKNSDDTYSLSGITIPAQYGPVCGEIGLKQDSHGNLIATAKCGVGVNYKFLEISINLVEAELQLNKDAPNLICRGGSRVIELLPCTDGATGPDGTWKNKNDKITVTKKQLKDAGMSDDEEQSLAGVDYLKEVDISSISSYFGKYTLSAIHDILSLRIKDLDFQNIKTLQGVFIDQNHNNIADILTQIFNSVEKTILVPLNLLN